MPIKYNIESMVCDVDSGLTDVMAQIEKGGLGIVFD